jgi:N-acylneuraminate cytidylyltransferase
MTKHSLEIHALIPARSGSKGIKNKNIVKINNKELIGYTIETAKQIRLINKVIVSTDSVKIKKIAERFGAEVPFLRPLEFARDNSSDLDVFKHYIFWLKKVKKKIPNLIVHLRPTTPLRDGKKLSEAISLMLRKKNASCLRSFTYSNFSPYKTWKFKKKGGGVEPVLLIKRYPEAHSTSRHKLPKTLAHISIIDILRPKKTILKNSICGNSVIPFIYFKKDLYNFVDIDKKDDLKKFKLIVKK